MHYYQRLQHYSKEFYSYHISTHAASASFFIITAIFPLLIVIFSIVGYTSLDADELIEMLMSFLPESLAPVVSQYVRSLVASSSATTLSVSVLATLWAASRSMLGLMDGLNSIAGVNDTRGYLFKRVICIGYMLVLVFGLVLTLGLRVFGESILSALDMAAPALASLFERALRKTSSVMLFVILGIVFMLIYTFFPNRKCKFYLQIPGAVFTSLGWLIFSAIFSVYVSRFGQFSLLYGSLTMLIMAFLWLYFCMYIVFIGAVINKMYPDPLQEFLDSMQKRRQERKQLPDKSISDEKKE